MSARAARLAGTALAIVATAPVLAAEEMAFVSCPIVRDTRTVPCWLTEYRGELYYIGIQTDVSAPFNPPSLGHRVLVEGTVQADRPRICGGLVIEPVTISVINERADDCRTMLPSEDRYQLPFEPPRPPGPSRGRLAFDNGPPPAKPQPPFTPRTFTVPYDFDGTVGFKTPRFLVPIVEYAQLANASRIEITGYRSATRLTDGSVLTEREGLARRRAEEVAQLLRGAGLTAPSYEVKWVDAAESGGPEGRRVTVVVTPR